MPCLAYVKDLCHCSGYLDDLFRRINDELYIITTWLKVNKPSLDIMKTHYAQYFS